MNTTNRKGPSEADVAKAVAALRRELTRNAPAIAAILAQPLPGESVRYCASCGEREGSVYAKHCCTDDNMLEG